MLKRLLLLSLICLFDLSCAGSQDPAAPDRPLPPHHSADGFRNPHAERPKRGPLAYYRMRYISREEFAEYRGQQHLVPQQRADLPRLRQPGELPQVTWIGHASVLLQYRGLNILTDPVFSARASPLGFYGPKRVIEPAIALGDLPPIDYVVISHNHYDHLDLSTVRAIGNRPVWLVPLKLKQWFVDAGLAKERIIELDWWQQQAFAGVLFTATPSQHWSKRGLWDANRTLWAAWHIRIDDFSAWFAGDTGYNQIQFKQIGEKLGPIDLGLIPIGGYAPRWFMKRSHVDPHEAVQLHREIGAARSIGIHWGTFPLTAEPIDEPPRRLADAIRQQQLPAGEFITLAIGQTLVLAPGESPATKSPRRPRKPF